MATLTVGSGKQYAHLADAINASQDGDVIQVQAGTYANDFASVNHKITIVGVGGMAKLTATQQIGNGKGILITNTDVTLENIEFSGAKVADHNGAGVRYQGGTLTIKNCYFHDNENGILANAAPTGKISIDHSEFAHNGYGDGYTHGAYIGEIQTLTVTNSYFHDTLVGHHLKSRAHQSIIENNRLVDGSGGTSSYSIDLPNGGAATIRGNEMIQADTGQNPVMVFYAGESAPYAGSSLTIDGNIFSNYKTSGTGLYNNSSVVAEFTNNQVYHLPTLVSGPSHQSGTVILTTAPALDTTSPWTISDSGTTAPAPTPTPTTGSATILGTAGNDILTGTDAAQTIDGGAGADTMTGKGGNDTYIVDNSGDKVVEYAGGGTDSIHSSVAYSLPSEVENLVLTGTANIKGTGNGLANSITGNSGENMLRGGTGGDLLDGGSGFDWASYTDSAAGVRVDLAQGLGQYGSAQGDVLKNIEAVWGSGYNDVMIGNGGNNAFYGGKGMDRMTGGAGSDNFMYKAATDGAAVYGNTVKGTVAGDQIVDFQSGIDKITLSSKGFALPVGELVQGKNFVVLDTAFNGTNAAAATNFAGKQPVVIVDNTGTVYYDANGTDAGYTVLATVQQGAKVTVHDISVYYDMG